MRTELFNACEYLLDRRLDAGDGDRLALTGPAGELTYAQLHDRVLRAAGALRGLGLQPEQRVLMFMADSPEFVIVYLAAMRIGAIPVPVSTMIPPTASASCCGLPRPAARGHRPSSPGLASEAVAAAPELRGVLGPAAGPGTRAACPGTTWTR